jgi:hypothetical protein
MTTNRSITGSNERTHPTKLKEYVMPKRTNNSKSSPSSQLMFRHLKTAELLPIVPAFPGYFRIFIEDSTANFEPILDPIIAWRIDEFSNAMPVTFDEFNEGDGTFAVLHPSGRVTYPCFGEFASLIHLADFVNRYRRTQRKNIKSDRHAELIAMFG